MTKAIPLKAHYFHNYPLSISNPTIIAQRLRLAALRPYLSISLPLSKSYFYNTTLVLCLQENPRIFNILQHIPWLISTY